MKVCTHLTCRACWPWLSAREHLYSSDATTTLTTAPAAGSQLVSAAAAAQRIETTSSVMQLLCCHSSIMAWQLAHEILRLCNYAAATEHSDSYLATQCLFKSEFSWEIFRNREIVGIKKPKSMTTLYIGKSQNV